MNRPRLLCLLLSFIALPLASDVSNPPTARYEPSLEHRPSIVERVDRLIAGLPEEFTGTILLGVGDSILMNKGYGMADRAHDIPNTANTNANLA